MLRCDKGLPWGPLMKTVFAKAVLATLLSIAGSLLAVVSIVPALGGVVDGNAWLMAIVCPTVVAFPASSYTFWQSSRLRRAHAELKAALDDLAAAHTALTERSRRDQMTGLLNRENFFIELESRRRKSDEGALLIIDADHFKMINDRYGHLTGDRALLEISAAIERGVRAGDLIGRIGGEEFAALLVGATGVEALQVAERVRLEVERISFHPDETTRLPLTVSIGGAQLEAGVSVREHMRVADKRLYTAKRNGRNQTVFEIGMKVAA